VHRKHVRATVDGADADIPISTFAPLQFLYYNGEFITTAAVELPANIVTGVPPTLDNAIARWNGVDGTSIQNSLVIISDTAQVTGVTALNGRDIARWTDGPAVGGATDNAVARWDTATGRLLQNSTVVIDDAGAVTGVTTINAVDVSMWVRGPTPAVSTDNAIARWDSTSGRLLQNSTIIVSDTGAITGVVSINGFTWTGDYVRGPTPATSGQYNLAIWTDTGGRAIMDGLLHINNVVRTFISESVTGHLPEYADSTGRILIDSGLLSDHVVQSPSTSTDNAVARFDGATGKFIQTSLLTIDDSGNLTGVVNINGRPVGNFVTGPASATHNVIACFNGATGKAVYMGGSTVTLAGTTISNVTTLTGRPVAQLIQGPFLGAVAGNVMTWNSGTEALDSGVSIFNVVRNAGGFSNDNRIVRTDTATHANAVQQSAIAIDDSGNMTGVASISTTTINGSAAGRLLAYSGSVGNPILNEIPAFDTTSSPYVVSYRPVTIDTSGNIQTPGTLNGRDPDLFVAGPASATDNAIARFDATTGKLIQNSTVSISDAGAMTGGASIAVSGAITALTVNGIAPEAHAARHRTGGADALFAAGGDRGDIYTHGLNPSDPLQPIYRNSSETPAGTVTGSYLTLSTAVIARQRSPTSGVSVHAWIPYAISDTGSDMQLVVQWSNASGRAVVECSGRAGHVTASGGVVTIDTGVADFSPAGIIHVFWSLTSVTFVSSIGLGIRSTGSSHSVYVGHVEVSSHG
jgi:hypothetical protein